MGLVAGRGGTYGDKTHKRIIGGPASCNYQPKKKRVKKGNSTKNSKGAALLEKDAGMEREQLTFSLQGLGGEHDHGTHLGSVEAVTT